MECSYKWKKKTNKKKMINNHQIWIKFLEMKTITLNLYLVMNPKLIPYKMQCISLKQYSIIFKYQTKINFQFYKNHQ